MTATLVLRALNSAIRSENADISVGQTNVKSRLIRWHIIIIGRKVVMCVNKGGEGREGETN
jgi:hypothetical protein